MKRTLSRMALTVLALGLAGGVVDSALGRPVLPAERRHSPYTSLMPACDDPHVLGLITGPFREKEYDFWHSDLQIVGYDRIVQQAFRAEGRDHIPRRYCTARAFLNDRSRRDVVYWVGENTGYAGYDYGVEWCIIGLDRNLAFGPSCRAARP